ncbi:MaoC family dehydratase [Parendozoicomonas haliclonae]|uniref:Bifunctional enoyl-CoA hydratase/phosphate acetyltransferase n=1 Tax=Parendozoicomonas haliclonae TaxID=1960125 RepID=A0A1X7AHA0_9GAMM|nr:MaoC/PaaZ C-terminal domain-containing protein [Parendozoicomonas haliclonae]SMA42320.1 bifunctional enoyl-CoA hydratase/phosphate acetyltransferase [Parendozoicomonas haliclonae]
MQTLALSSMPSMLSLYAKAARKKGHAGELPALSVSVAGVRANAQDVKTYEKICHFPQSRFLPATFLHILAFPLHMRLLTDPTMPLKPMGLVHVRNTLRQLRPVEKGELLHIECSIGESREVEAGLEFDILTRIEASGELVYEGISTNLRRQSSPSAGGKKQHQAFDALDVIQTWSLGSSLGRQYGAVSGDRNPIHLWPVTAKLFGFKRHIAHGMWSKARCLAALTDDIAGQPFELEVVFKTPVFLPAKVEFSRTSTTAKDAEGRKVDFRLRSSSGKPHLEGRLTLI